eukprot:TRINITY_DN3531_c0_g1_i1.p1 TRINITY_DN3531_c0_g1~~TRINITY_DN3531_c0_g1_i1.p1  ORF type:complete len:174 (-),score=34.93 TRINITY_DN3531_c0_g1_i1:42-563(-)
MGPKTDIDGCNWHFFQCHVPGNLFTDYFYLLSIGGIIVFIGLIILIIVLICKCGCNCSRSISGSNYHMSVQRQGSGSTIFRREQLNDAKPDVVKQPSTKRAPALPMVNIEDIDKTNLPDGFEPEPHQPHLPNNATEEEYKDFMREKYEYERWENKLILYYRKKAQAESLGRNN